MLAGLFLLEFAALVLNRALNAPQSAAVQAWQSALYWALPLLYVPAAARPILSPLLSWLLRRLTGPLRAPLDIRSCFSLDGRPGQEAQVLLRLLSPSSMILVGEAGELACLDCSGDQPARYSMTLRHGPESWVLPVLLVSRRDLGGSLHLRLRPLDEEKAAALLLALQRPARHASLGPAWRAPTLAPTKT